MVEPDRTIMIVSIIGIVIIWGSFFYHKFVQGGKSATRNDLLAPDVEIQSEEKDAASPNKKKKSKR